MRDTELRKTSNQTTEPQEQTIRKKNYTITQESSEKDPREYVKAVTTIMSNR